MISTETFRSYSDSKHEYFSISKPVMVSEETMVVSGLINLNYPEVRDHIVQGKITLPGAVYIDIVMQSFKDIFKDNILRLRRINWLAPMFFNDDKNKEIDIIFEKLNNKHRFFIRNDRLNSKGEIENSSNIEPAYHISVKRLKQNFKKFYKKEDIYKKFTENHFMYKNAYQVIEELYANNFEALGRIKNNNNLLSPMIIDGAFQTVIGVMMDDKIILDDIVWVPFFIEEITIYDNVIPNIIYSHIKRDISNNHKDKKKFMISLIDESGKVYVHIKNFTLKAFSRS